LGPKGPRFGGVRLGVFWYPGMTIRAIELAKSTSLNSKALHTFGVIWGHLGHLGEVNLGHLGPPPVRAKEDTKEGAKWSILRTPFWGLLGGQKGYHLWPPARRQHAPFGHQEGPQNRGLFGTLLGGPFGGIWGVQFGAIWGVQFGPFGVRFGSFGVLRDVGVLGVHVAVSTFGTDVTKSAGADDHFGVRFWHHFGCQSEVRFWGHFGVILDPFW